MAQDQLNFFRDGYDEARDVAIFSIQEALATAFPVEAVSELLQTLINDRADDRWRDVQTEFPEIIRDEYEESFLRLLRILSQSIIIPTGSLSVHRNLPSFVDDQMTRWNFRMHPCNRRDSSGS